MKKKDIWISVAIVVASALVFYFYTQREGYVQIDAGGADAILTLRSGLLSNATISSREEPSALSARAHNPRFLSISMKQDGQTWQIESRGPWADLSKIRIKGNQTTTLRLGPPFLIEPSVSRSSSSVSIDFAVIGQAGEQYQKFVTRDNRTVADAKATIVDEAGNVLATGKFRYG